MRIGDGVTERNSFGSERRSRTDVGLTIISGDTGQQRRVMTNHDASLSSRCFPLDGTW